MNKERIVKPSILRDTHRFFTPARVQASACGVEMASALDIQDETSDHDVASAIGSGALA